jgi:hypothetical protein
MSRFDYDNDNRFADNDNDPQAYSPPAPYGIGNRRGRERFPALSRR